MPLYLKDKLVSGTGAPGKSAYQTAVDAGYAGTETAFNEALKDVPGHIANTENPHGVTAAQAGAVASTEKGAASGVATLGADALLAAAQRPKAGGLYRDDGKTTLEKSLAEISTTLQNTDPRRWGIGSSAKEIASSADLDDIYQGGLYCWDTGVSNVPFEWGLMIVLSSSDFLKGRVQIAYDRVNKTIAIRWLNTTWSPWEYQNPPMKEGVEYRTTERHLGKPVYKKRFTTNALPNNAQLEKKNVINASTDSLFDLHITFVDIPSGAVSSYPPFYNSTVAARAWVRGTGELIITTFADLSSTKAIVTLKYTKTID